jgi:hypothetical protein
MRRRCIPAPAGRRSGETPIFGSDENRLAGYPNPPIIADMAEVLTTEQVESEAVN